MGKQTKALYAQLIKMMEEERNRKAPENKPLDYITQQSIAGADLLKSRDYRDLGRDGNMFFDYQMPAEQMKAREMEYNAGQTGTFGLADNAGSGAAHALQAQFLKDKFARDASQNFQNNIQTSAANIRGGLATAAGGVASANDAETNRRMGILGAFNNLYQFKKATNQAASTGLMTAAISGGVSAASAGMGAKWGK